MLKILKYPSEALVTVSKEVLNKDIDSDSIVEDLEEVAKRVDNRFNLWLGMAAPQIGINKRVFILRRKHKVYTPFINPEIVKKKFFLPAVSRCYSVKGIYFPKRYYWIKLRYQTMEGDIREEVFIGPSAFVVQHEIDHLNGKLIIDSR